MVKAAENISDHISFDDLWELWSTLKDSERGDWFEQLNRIDAEDFFISITSEDQADLLAGMSSKERRIWMRLLAPDDAADVLQVIDSEELRESLKMELDVRVRKEVVALMAYEEDEAGGLMSPRFARIRPDMTVDEAIAFIRKQMSEELETIYYIYVLDTQRHLLGVVSLEDLFKCVGNSKIRDIMETDLTTINDETDQETVAILFAREDFFALPVVDENNVMQGIITIDDVVDVVQDEATEDMQKFGGMAALDTPYFQTDILSLYTKRVGWLIILFLGSLFTTKAMSHYEDAMAKVVVLSIFVPLIISTGGNSGSQAATLITRAFALGELRLRDIGKVFRRELIVGGILGLTLGFLGFARVIVAHYLGYSDFEYYLRLSLVISFSTAACVLSGSIFGSMLPFVLKFFKVDPATASAPFVATLVDVTGIFVYFSISHLFLSNVLG